MCLIRNAEQADNAALASIIRGVLPEFGAMGEGYAIADPEVDMMFETYQNPRSRFYVLEHEGIVKGGGGIAPLRGADSSVCELQKFYFLPEVRGLGFGNKILTRCLGDAKRFGFKRCYLETLKGMDTAIALYQRHGFTPLTEPLGNTGHYKCNAWFAKEI